MIHLVPDAGQHGKLRGKDGPGHGFLVEAGEIIGRSAAADDDDDLGRASGVGLLHGLGDFGARADSLHLDLIEFDMAAEAAVTGVLQEIVDDSALL